MGIAAMSHYADGTREDEMHVRRKAKRERSFLRGRIYFNNGRNTVDCLIRDISYEGARIIFSEPADVPDEVQLYIPDRRRLVLAHVRWRHADKLGLSFSELLPAREYRGRRNFYGARQPSTGAASRFNNRKFGRGSLLRARSERTGRQLGR